LRKPPGNGLAADDREALRRNRGAQGEGARAHSLTTPAMTSHRQERRGADANSHFTTAALTIQRQSQLAHDVVSVVVRVVGAI